MALPLSRTQIEKLGKRLVAADKPAPEDLLLLNELQIAYRDALADTVRRVEALVGFEASSRVKTQGTTLDKLRLNGGSWLSAIQDLAGMRIVADVDRAGQDAIVASIVTGFADAPKAPKVIDRRVEPSSGYRAVHVVVFPAGVQVEIQVRTVWQHEWADLYEKLADRLGRGVRYGKPPRRRWQTPEDVPLDDRVAAKEAFDRDWQYRLMLVGYMQDLSELIATYEEALQRDPDRRGEFEATVERFLTGLRSALSRLH